MKDKKSKNAVSRAPLGDVIRQVTRLFARYDLDYAQTGYVVKCVRKNLGLAPERNRKKLQELISPTEADAIIATAYRQNPLYGLIIKSLWLTMVRVAEVVALQVTDLKAAEGYAKVRAGKGNEDRLIVVPRDLAQELTSYIGKRRRGPIFVSQRRNAFTTRRIQQITQQAAAAAKITTRVTPHTFRRSMATTLLNRGVREEVVSTLLGHNSTETTRAAYAKLSIKSLSLEVEKALKNQQKQ